ncbi:MAG: hypothetical protein IJ308_08365 [Clostridia bacterium]|nr:hypothetical protein [Clostridia bacterium]MBQ7913732.1 hypothetical protein [Clostridia bacterium]
MKKYFLFELKKARWQLIIITAIFTILFGTIAAVMQTQTKIESYDGTVTVITNSPLVSLIAGAMSLMCFVAPVLVYQFKMNKRNVDCYYALPLKKRKLYFVKTLIGLLLVLIPFTVAYWATFLIFLIKPGNPYNMGWFVPAYFGLVFFAVCLYGYNAFAFTRGNSVVDGVALMMGYQAVMILIVLVPWMWSRGELFSWRYLLDFVPEWGQSFFTLHMETKIIGSTVLNELGTLDLGFDMNVMTFLMPALRGAAGYGLLFYLLKYDKAEDSQQISDSWFAYKTLIPIFAATIIGLIEGMILELSLSVALVVFVMFAIAVFVLCIVWRRKFAFGKTGWIVYGIALGAAVVIAIITWLVFKNWSAVY